MQQLTAPCTATREDVITETKPPLTVPREFLDPPGTVNPTLLMFLAAVAIAIGSTVGYWRWGWPGWCCFSLNVLALHLAGTVIHDASHFAAHRDRLINACLGHGSALLLGFSFPVFTRVHMQHHAHVNDPDNDPDHFVSTGGPLWLIAARFFYHEIFFFKRCLWRKYELLEWFLGRLAVGLIVYAAYRYDFLGFVMNFWFCPALVVGLMLGLFFDYLPHRPFQERDRWKNARVYPSPVLNLLILGQNYHLIHHLWPSIPWYRYQAAYYAMQPLLDAKGCHQSLGLFQGKDFLSFVYDVFLGIRFHRRRRSQNQD
ncbi:beta-carotene hydroxylase [Trichothermofontia sp.]